MNRIPRYKLETVAIEIAKSAYGVEDIFDLPFEEQCQVEAEAARWIEEREMEARHQRIM